MEKIYSLLTNSPIGGILIEGNKNSILSISLMPEDMEVIPEPLKTNSAQMDKSDLSLPTQEAYPDVILQCKNELDLYFSKKLTTFTVPLELIGTTMQKAVWNELLKVPYGVTVSYKDLSLASGYGRAYRAVGTAVGKNEIPIIIPCHRVISSDGSLGGFSSGLNKKIWLLELEDVRVKA